jgi:hypothetical protein
MSQRSWVQTPDRAAFFQDAIKLSLSSEILRDNFLIDTDSSINDPLIFFGYSPYFKNSNDA